MRKNIFLTLTFLVFILPQILCGQAGYIYKAYDFDMTVREDNTYRITETVDVEFGNMSLHGLLYRISLDTSNYINATVSEVEVAGHPFETYIEDEAFFIKIGDPNKTVNEKDRYVISYTYSIGDDAIKKYDEVYHNIIGTGGGYFIENITFTIRMPKEFDAKLINFTVGDEGSTNGDGVEYKINDDFSITGTSKDLNTGQGLTMRIELPQGYFDKVIPRKADFADTLQKYSYVIFPLVLLIGFAIWRIYGKSDPVVPVVEFYPPENATPADIGYIIDGEVDPKDITSLLIYWADKGYMRIVENKPLGLLRKKSFTFHKVKSLPKSAHDYEKKMFDAIFTYGSGSSVTTEDLEDNFYNQVTLLTAMIKKHWYEEMFEQTKISAESMLIILSALTMTLVLSASWMRTIPDMFVGKWLILTIFLLLLVSGFIVFLVHLFATSILGFGKKGCIAKVVFVAVAPIPPAVIIAIGASSDTVMITVYALVIAVIFNFLSCFAKKRSKRGVEYQGRLLGFKQFLLAAEKDKINMLVEENPQYFYNILPYALVLGVTDKWAKNFTTIAISPPDWYSSDASDGRTFHVTTFSSNLAGGMSAISNSMISAPSDGVDMGSGGGGSVGGGSGGSSSSGW